MEKSLQEQIKELKGTFDEVWGEDEFVSQTMSRMMGKERIKEMATPYLWSPEELYSRKLIFPGMAQQEVLNAFRNLRIKLLEKAKTDNMVVLVSSLVPDGGASFIAMNLAATFALDEHKTALYVDCNPLHSKADDYVVEPIERGISDYLKDYSTKIDQIIYPSGLDRLRVIPAGNNVNAVMEDFNTQRMSSLINELKGRYRDRFIVLDAAAIQSSTEARVIAKHADLVLLVVPFGKSTTQEVQAAVDTIGKEKYAGLVFNN